MKVKKTRNTIMDTPSDRFYSDGEVAYEMVVDPAKWARQKPSSRLLPLMDAVPHYKEDPYGNLLCVSQVTTMDMLMVSRPVLYGMWLYLRYAYNIYAEYEGPKPKTFKEYLITRKGHRKLREDIDLVATRNCDEPSIHSDTIAVLNQVLLTD